MYFWWLSQLQANNKQTWTSWCPYIVIWVYFMPVTNCLLFFISSEAVYSITDMIWNNMVHAHLCTCRQYLWFLVACQTIDPTDSLCLFYLCVGSWQRGFFVFLCFVLKVWNFISSCLYKLDENHILLLHLRDVNTEEMWCSQTYF